MVAGAGPACRLIRYLGGRGNAGTKAKNCEEEPGACEKQAGMGTRH